MVCDTLRYAVRHAIRDVVLYVVRYVMYVQILCIGQLLINGAVFSDNASHVIADSYQKVCGIQRKKRRIVFLLCSFFARFVPFWFILFLFFERFLGTSLVKIPNFW